MLIYFIILKFFIIFCFYKINYNDSRFIFITLVITLILFSSFRYDVGVDYLMYYEMVSNFTKRLGYDFSEVSLNSNAIYASMKSDKKNTEKDSISLILLKNVGEPFIYNENDGSKLLEFLERFIKNFE